MQSANLISIPIKLNQSTYETDPSHGCSIRFSLAESVMQVMTFQSHNQYPQLKESDAINDITAKTCQSETSTTNLNESFETCCLFSIGEILFPIDS